MKANKHFLLVSVLFLLCSAAVAQDYFVNTYGIYANPCNSLICSDQGFFAAMSFSPGRLGVMKTDAEGNISWSKEFDFTGDITGLKDIEQAADGGFLVLVDISITGVTNNYQTVVKFDPEGNFLWTRSYYALSGNTAGGIIKNKDNGFMFTGGGCDGSDYVIKCDQQGNIVWQKQFAPSGAGFAASIATHDYDHFVVSGYTGTDLIFFETDTFGNLYWHSVISFPNAGLVPRSLKPTLDGGYIATGQVKPDAAAVNKPFIIKADSTGALTWLKIYNVPYTESVGMDITETSDNNFLMVGFANSGDLRGLMVKTDNDGNLLFGKSEPFQQSYTEYNSVNRYSPGAVLLSGQCQNGFLPTFIALTDNSFSSFCNITDLALADSVPAVSSDYITYTPYDLAFAVDSLPVSLLPLAFTKTVLCTSTGTGNVLRKDGAEVFPNPFSTSATVSMDQPVKEATVTLYNSSGMRVRQQTYFTGQTLPLHRENLPGGLYLLQVSQDGRTCATARVIISDK